MLSTNMLTTVRSPWILAVAIMCVMMSSLWVFRSITELDVTTYSENVVAPISSGSYQAPSADPEPTEAEEKPETDAFTVTIVDEAASEVEAALEAVTNATETDTDKTLIIYVYADSESALANLKFFLAHGMHGAADFVFVINGDTGTDVAGLVPKKDNVRVVERPNDCYDLGALAEVLTQGNLYQGYKKFITMNASIRGPFIPHWSEGCWSDMFLNKITDEVKLVGISANCWPVFHIQSMIWATDRVGIEILLFPPQEALDQLAANNPIHDAPESATWLKDIAEQQQPGINGCFHDWKSAVTAEVSSTPLIRAAGYQVDALMNAYHGLENEQYEKGEACERNQDAFWNGMYFGINVHPFETIFFKSNRGVDTNTLDKHTEWINKKGYSSYDYCKA